jgi:hypothetical protein
MDQGPSGIATQSLEAIRAANDYGSWFWFIFISVVFFIIWYGLLSLVDIAEISRNWPKYRCSPSIMPFASAFGHDTSENFNYCIHNIFKNQMGESTGPYNTILGSMATSMMEFLKNLNSLRIMMATLLGGITRVFQEFTDRFKLFMAQVQTSSLKLQMLMKRVFGTFYAVIYMGLSTIQTGQNFSQTFIFKFIDTFCFPPDTHVLIQGRGIVPIESVVLGDQFKTGEKVLSVYKFMAYGQPMVSINSIEVSTNHLIQYKNDWIQAKDHPDAIPTGIWTGGVLKPLICLDTSSHCIPIENEIFSDWDETSKSDTSVMKLVDIRLNGSSTEAEYNWLYQPSLDGTIEVYMANGTIKQISELCLGDTFVSGYVQGLGMRSVQQVCCLPSGKFCTPSQLIWCGKDSIWKRAGHIYSVLDQPMILYTLSVMNSAVVETTVGVFRDMIEIYSDDIETITLEKMIDI